MEQNLNDICASIQHTIVSYLMRKLKKAVTETGINEIAISGGVSANSGLRTAVKLTSQKLGWRVHIPALEYCTDNAAMIAQSAHFQYVNEDFADQSTVPYARLNK